MKRSNRFLSTLFGVEDFWGGLGKGVGFFCAMAASLGVGWALDKDGPYGGLVMGAAAGLFLYAFIYYSMLKKNICPSCGHIFSSND